MHSGNVGEVEVGMEDNPHQMAVRYGRLFFCFEPKVVVRGFGLEHRFYSTNHETPAVRSASSKQRKIVRIGRIFSRWIPAFTGARSACQVWLVV